MNTLPPARARRWLARLLPTGERTDLLEFIDDIWSLRLRTDGPRRAHLWYWSQLVSCPLRVAAERFRHHLPSPRPRDWIHAMFDELRLAARRLRQAPAFALTTILTLGLGLGANTAIFSLVKSVLLDPLPYHDADRLVSLWHTAPGAGIAEFEQSEATYLFYGEQARTLDALAGWDTWSGALTGVEVPERLLAARFTENVLATLGVNPLIGRGFEPHDVVPGAPLVAILSHGLWQRTYGSDPDVLGEVMTLDGSDTEIIGVMPEAFAFPGPETSYWIPMPYDRAAPEVSNFSMYGLGRLAPGADLAALNDELAVLLKRLPEFHSDGLINAGTIEQVGMAAYARPYLQDIVGRVNLVLWVLVGAVGFVLLVSAANVANLFLVRAESREREIAVRAALGAGRRGLARLFLADSVIVAALGAMLSLMIATVALGVLRSIEAIDIPRIAELDLDAGVLAFNTALAAIAGLLLSVYPLLRYRGSHLLAGLREGARGATGSQRRLGARNALVAAQVALALVLLVGSALMTRSFWYLVTVDPGFDPSNVLTARLMLVDRDVYPRRTDLNAFYEQLVDRLEALPGVLSAASTNALPMRNFGDRSGAWFEDFPRAEGELPDIFYQRWASPGYFHTLGIPVIRGREFERADHQERRPVMLISRSVAERLWPGQDPVGKRARRGPTDDDPWLTVVGVVGDVRNEGLTNDPVETVYYAIDGPNGASTWYPSTLSFAARTDGDPLAHVGAVRDAIRQIDPNLPVTAVLTMERIVADTIAPVSFATGALIIAAALALTLGLVGIYGLVSYVVGHRTREIGVRMALGARRGSVVQMVLSQGLRLALAGVTIGLVGAAMASRFLSALLFDVSPLDPVVFGLTAAALVAVTLLATYVPARRAAAVDPATALRSDSG